jgi:uncharacterized protein (TIGR01370 family)
MLTRRVAAFSLIASALNAQRRRPQRSDKWLVYYGSREQAETFFDYSFVILDSRYHPPLVPLRRNGTTAIGYLSLGEASPDYSYFKRLESAGLLVRPSPTWQGNQFIDLRDRRWRAMVCDELVPWVLQQGFDGVFLDTVDSALSLEETGTDFRGMSSAAAELILEIRRRHPAISIVLNRGYKLLPAVDQALSAAMGESVFATYDFARKQYVFVDPPLYQQQVAWLQAAKQRNQRLKVLTLDYCDPRDTAAIKRVYAEERGNGFLPYVATIDLTQIIREPA